MQNIFGNIRGETLDPDQHAAFRQRLSLDNCRRAFVVSIIGVSFLLLLFGLDWVRWKEGTLFNSPINLALTLTHWLVAMLVIPLVLIWQNFEKIKSGAFGYGRKLTNLTLFILAGSILPMAVLSLMQRDSVAIYAIYVSVVNIVISLPHRERIWLNGLSIGGFMLAIVFFQFHRPELLLMNIAESLALTIPNFIFATYQYNLYLRQFKDNQLLNDQKKEIETEKGRSDQLLYNILPVQIAEELKQNNVVKPRLYKEVSVLFTDFKGFSAICRQLSPEMLIDDLSYCFGHFDEIASRHGVERIKTIGDAYMCVCGIPVERPDHAVALVQVALEMQEFLREWKSEREQKGLPVYEARIGIHSGPVMAGIVGQQKFAFDIWGDTVNVAARMEEHGEPGRVNLSGATQALVADQFEIVFRGELPIKHIGAVEMYFVQER